MRTKSLTDVLERVEAWPPAAQDQLAEIATELEAALTDLPYEPTATELAGIDRGLRDVEQGRFATDADVEAALRKLRGA
jgi:predicted transcriptional regulator